jgi:hypothetical protein
MKKFESGIRDKHPGSALVLARIRSAAGFRYAKEKIGKGINYGTVHTVHEIVWLKRHT